MNPLHLPWIEASIAVSLLGALCVGRARDATDAYRLSLTATGTALACACLAALAFYLGVRPESAEPWSVQPYLFGRSILMIDQLNAPLVPAVALLHFLTTLTTARTKARRFSFVWSLAGDSIRLALFGCTEPWALIGLLVASTVPPYVELVNRRRPTRIYLLHTGLFLALLLGGWFAVESGRGPATAAPWAAALLMAAVFVRCGAVPAHCWLTDWFEHASFGKALLTVAPLPGVYAAVRLVLPVAPDAVLRWMSLISLATAVYAAGMAVVQRDVRRFFAYLFLSHAALVLVGLELHSLTSLTGALCLWISVPISLGGFGLTLRALEARYGRLTLTSHRGLYEQSPTLAACFLLTGLASVGFPGTLGFVSTDLLVDGAVSANLPVGLAVIAAAALNGIAVVRAYFLLFTGARHAATVSLRIGARERLAVLTLSALILGGGLFPQPGVTTRQLAAEEILDNRRPAGPPNRLGHEGEARRALPANGLLPAPVRRDLPCPLQGKWAELLPTLRGLLMNGPVGVRRIIPPPPEASPHGIRLRYAEQEHTGHAEAGRCFQKTASPSLRTEARVHQHPLLADGRSWTCGNRRPRLPSPGDGPPPAANRRIGRPSPARPPGLDRALRRPAHLAGVDDPDVVRPAARNGQGRDTASLAPAARRPAGSIRAAPAAPVLRLPGSGGAGRALHALLLRPRVPSRLPENPCL
jgi:NADH-quinone oxidoreductase subunit M